MRIVLNRYSSIIYSKNEKYYLNGIFIYGSDRCVYLKFENNK